jgi:TonB-dependent SusC/RagA subfamily outer membrane receptor
MKSITKHFKVPLLGACIMFAMAFLNYTSTDESVKKIINQFTKYHSLFPQQKIYLQTDKNKYLSGETIWLKAYLVDMASMLNDSTSKEIFIDLIDCSQKIVQSIVLKNNNGYSNGDLLLKDSIVEGNYQLRAYTYWMRNFDNEFFFSKTIEVKNPNYENIVTSKILSGIKEDNESFKQKEKQLFLSFFPEGGSMVCGLSNNVAFKAENGLGYGVDITGIITDDKGAKIADLKSIHCGLGSFEFTPETGKNYTAQLVMDGKNKTFALPKALDKGIFLKVDNSEKDVIRMSIQSNEELPSPANEIILLIQDRGKIVYMSKGVLTKAFKSSVSKKLFPAGIAQLTIFDGTGKPLCERLLFINPKPDTKIDVTSESNDDEISLHFKVTTKNGSSKKGNLSLAVTEQLPNQKNPVWQENILTKLLLTSDLKGKIENPMYYFNPANNDAASALDLVMLTHGWRRFIWQDILSNNFPNLTFTDLEGMGVTASPEINRAMVYPAIRNEVFDKEKLKNNTKQERTVNKVAVTSQSNLRYVSENEHYENVIELMRGSFAGVAITSSGISIRGVNTMNASNDPLILRDATQISFQDLYQIRPGDIESIEVLKGSDASMYGVRGGNGVIILHSRKAFAVGESHPVQTRNASVYKIHVAREFYVPRYEAWNYKPKDFTIPRTIFWKPSIVTDTAGIATVKFKNKTDVEKYSITVEGLTSTGDIILYNE